MFDFSSTARGLPLIVLVCSVHAQPGGHTGPPHDSKEQQGAAHQRSHVPMHRPHGEGQESRELRTGTPGVAGWAPHRGSYFTPDHQERARDYFDMPEHRGFVPPGLASKGGRPPGLTKKWQIGQPLPREVVFYALPRPLEIYLGPPPSGYRYVRIGTDILLIAIGTGIVVDALENLVR